MALASSPSPLIRPEIAALVENRARTAPVALAQERVLPVPDELAALLPERGLRRGSTMSIGSAGLLLNTLGEASAAGSWIAAVGMSALGIAAAAEAGVALERFVAVPDPDSKWSVVVAALLDALDIVIVQPPAHPRLSDARRLVARARERAAVLVVYGNVAWPLAVDVDLRLRTLQWQGIGHGHGHLRDRHVEMHATGRGAASRPKRQELWLAAAG